MITLSNRSHTWSKVCHFLWPLVIVTSGIRAIFIIWELNRGKDKIIWECENGGQLWGASEEAGYGNTSSFPNGICGAGWQSLYTAFIVSLLVDIIFQLYAFFLNWRFKNRLQGYSALTAGNNHYYKA
jgi:hypothetical protein